LKTSYAKVRAIQRALRRKNPNHDNDRAAGRVQARIAATLRCRFKAAFKAGSKRGAAVRVLGCTIAELRIWIASQFQQGMCWENYGAWHIDHKTPLSAFDLTDYAQVLIACNWKNLRPLWALDNLSKGAKTLWQPGLFSGVLSEAG
jgi:hypothetical protein